ncbi:MAG: sensor histidine kinase [Phycisphaerales bacterium JB065]
MPDPSSQSGSPQEERSVVLDLAERVKELKCLREVAAVFADRRQSLLECLDQVVSVLPDACRYPDRATARLRLDKVVVDWPRDSFVDSAPRISAPLRVGDRERGELLICYHDPPDGSDEIADARSDLFLVEEQALLEAVSRQVGVFVAGVEADQYRSEMEATLWHADRLATIGQLAAGVAHELNEPLGNVLGFAQLALKASGVPAQVRTDLGRIADAALHGREIIRKLLLFARQTPASKQPTAMNDVVDEAMFLLEAGCENPGIRFVRELEEGLPDIAADPVQMRQVVTNLVINAMQAISGTGTVRVRTSSRDLFVELMVEDNGGGMSPEVARRVFDPFFTTKEVGQGTGLGLAIVQGIVAEHGGTVEVQSKLGQGSVFRLLLPAAGGPRLEFSGQSR